MLDFVVAMERCSIYEAAQMMKGWFGLPFSQAIVSANSSLRLPPAQHSRVVVENKPLSFALSGIDPRHSYFAGREIGSDVAAHFGAGFYPGGGSMAGRIVIPIDNPEGDLIAYAGRSTNDCPPKYRFPTGFRKSQEVYNLHRAAACTHGGPVVVVEGFFDCWKVHQAGFPAVVALMGCAVSDIQAELLGQRFDAAVLFLDGDPAGRAATATVGKCLASKLQLRVAHCPDDRQPDQLSRTEICRCLTPVAVT